MTYVTAFFVVSSLQPPSYFLSQSMHSGTIEPSKTGMWEVNNEKI